MQATNGPVRMPQALKVPLSFNFKVGRIQLFPLLALWGNMNWPPSMNVKKLENFEIKIGYAGCKGSSLKAPGIESPLIIPI